MTFELLCIEHIYEVRCIIGRSSNGLGIRLFEEGDVWMEKFNKTLSRCRFLLVVKSQENNVLLVYNMTGNYFRLNAVRSSVISVTY
jgi:hypothetical protein